LNVAEGTYTEQVTIMKNLSLLGAGQATTTIQAFTNMPTCFTTSADYHPIVCVMDSIATIDGFTINGLGLGNTNTRFYGVAFHNAGGTLQNNAIIDIRDTPFSGTQHGVAVYAYNDDLTTYTVHVLDNTISGFQKNALVLNAAATTPIYVDVQGNTITGAGSTTVTAQNGIQVWADLVTGLVSGNTVTGIAYAGVGWSASSILNYYADLEITGNTITDAHTGIYNYDGGGLINENELAIIKTGDFAYGIIATDPPSAVPSPFDLPAALAGGSVDAIRVEAVLDVEITGNTITFTGIDKTGSVGIEADAGYGIDDLVLDVNHNTVTGFNYGLAFNQCTSDCSTGVYTGIAAVSNNLLYNTFGISLSGPIPSAVVPMIHHNRIFGDVATDEGLDNTTALAILAEDNWWGCNEGPGDATCVGITGLVDADPWLVLSAIADPVIVQPLGSSVVTADLITNSDDQDTSSDDYVPDGIPMAFTTPDGGSVEPITDTTTLGTGATTFTAPAADQDYQVCTEIDNELHWINVTVVNVAPVAQDNTYTTVEDTQLVMNPLGVLDNDTDANGDTLTAILDTTTPNGTLVLNADGSFSYTPNQDFAGVDTFTYLANDGVLISGIATVTITVTQVNDAPVAFNDEYSVAEDAVLTIAAPGVLANDTDAEGDALTVVLVTDVLNGTLDFNADGSFTYTPDANFFGTDTFTYLVTDGTGESNAATVTITVNDMPDLRILYVPILWKQ
jgi:VCBS repeat-containing protein